jgi:undecaprenyl diphosphate synthase
MDGNNRWGKKNNVQSFNAYKKGSNTLISISKNLFEKHNLKYISAFALSKNNLSRSKKLLNNIIKVLDFFLDRALVQEKFNFKIIFKGDLNFLSLKIRKKILNLSALNKSSPYTLFIFLNYSGTDDILKTSRLLKNQNFDFKKFKSYMTSGMTPDPEILVRTGGFQRISDFFLFQLSFTEFFFTKKLWPDLKFSDLERIIIRYQKIERKFGR